MSLNYFHIFKNKVILSEQEEDEDIPDELTADTPSPDEPEAPAVEPKTETDLDKILGSSKKVTSALVKLLSTYDKVTDKSKEEIRELVSDIRCISYKPTTFRVILGNGNYFDLKYNPTPSQLKGIYKVEPSDLFFVTINGKKYDISSKSEYEQALDGIQKIQREKAVLVKEPGENEPAPAPAPETPEAPAEEEPK